MFTRKWIWGRLLWPVLLAATTPCVHIFWPHNQEMLLLPMFLPCLAAVINMAISSAQRPRVKPVGYSGAYQKSLRNWHALDGLACLILMLFEIMVALCISMDQWGSAIGIGAVLYLPYAGVSMLARRHLLRAYEILTAGVVSGRKLVPADGSELRF